jgi:hypothetical protein
MTALFVMPLSLRVMASARREGNAMPQFEQRDEFSAAECERIQKLNMPLLSKLYIKIPLAKQRETLKKWRFPRDLQPEDPHIADILHMLLQFSVMTHLLCDRIDNSLSFLERQLRLARKTSSPKEQEFISQLHQGFRFCGRIIEYSAQVEDLVCVEDKLSKRAIWIYSPNLLAGDDKDYLTGYAFNAHGNTRVHHTTGPALWLPGALQTPQGLLAELLETSPLPTDIFWQKLLRQYFKHDFPLAIARRFQGNDFLSQASIPEPDSFTFFNTQSQVPALSKMITLNPSNPVDQCIMKWHSDESDVVRNRIRLYANLHVLSYLLELHFISGGAYQKPIEQATKAALFIVAETLIARDAAGLASRNASAGQINAHVSRDINRGALPPKALKLIEAVTSSVNQSFETQRSSDNPEIAKVIARIEALQMRTTERGFSEQEAYFAAEKLAELLDRYGSELEAQTIVQLPTQAVKIDTQRKRMAPKYFTIKAVTEFCDCSYWIESDTDGILTYIIFGLRQDSYAAQALFELIEQTFNTERESFQATTTYLSHDRGGRRAALHAFEHGLATRITMRLSEIKQASRAKHPSSTGTDLVIIKEQKIQSDLDLLGYDFKRKSLNRTVSDMQAFDEGYQRGENFDI